MYDILKSSDLENWAGARIALIRLWQRHKTFKLCRLYFEVNQ